MAGNSPFQVGPGDSDGVKIPNVPTGFFGATPVNQQSLTLASLPSSLPLTTANVQGITTTLTQIKTVLTNLGLIA